MKTLLQRFTIWFNQSRERVGRLWESRFKSLLIEGDWGSVMAVAAYVDRNAVRAGLVDDPKDYRWCGYAEAVVGKQRARVGLMRLYEIHHRTARSDASGTEAADDDVTNLPVEGVNRNAPAAADGRVA